MGYLFVPKGQAQNAQAQMFSDPNMAMDMMKKEPLHDHSTGIVLCFVDRFS